MDGVPENAAEIVRYLLEEVLVDIELDPGERQDLLRYMGDRHDDLYGPFTTYFVLGSYETPFKWRLETVATELNRRLDAYAYLLASQPDPEVGSDALLSVDDPAFPNLKLKYSLHALYADHVVLVLEHNEGGALTELGRENVSTFFERTRLLPRGWDTDAPETVADAADVRRVAYQAAYDSTDMETLRERMREIVDRAADAGLSTTEADLVSDLEGEFGQHLPPRYSGVLTDEFDHYDRAGRSYPWLTEPELRERVAQIP